jgi:hypothetical protein
MRANGRYLDCILCETEIAKWGDEEFDWVNGQGPYCEACNRWQSQIFVLEERIVALEAAAQRSRGAAQRQDNMRRASSPYDLSRARR